jgi:hypothetical protein
VASKDLSRADWLNGSDRIRPEESPRGCGILRVDEWAHQPESGSEADAAISTGAEEPRLFSRGGRAHRPRRRNRRRLAPVVPGGERGCPGKSPVCAAIEVAAEHAEAVPGDSNAGGSCG